MTQYQTRFANYIARRQADSDADGKTFDPSDLNPNFISHYNAGERRRVKVQFQDGTVKWGRVGATTGWKPCFILLHNRQAMFSHVTIGEGDRIVDYKDLPR